MPITAKFSLYSQHGIKVYFEADPLSLNADDIAAAGTLTDSALATLMNCGFTITADGNEPLPSGAKTEVVTGYVVGERSDGQPCVWLYGAEQLEFKVATVWQEDIAKLPISADLTTTWPGAAPTREIAERKQVLISADFEIILVPSGKKTEKGKDIMRFERVVGYAPALTAPQVDGIDLSAAERLIHAQQRAFFQVALDELEIDSQRVKALLKEAGYDNLPAGDGAAADTRVRMFRELREMNDRERKKRDFSDLYGY